MLLFMALQSEKLKRFSTEAFFCSSSGDHGIKSLQWHFAADLFSTTKNNGIGIFVAFFDWSHLQHQLTVSSQSHGTNSVGIYVARDFNGTVPCGEYFHDICRNGLVSVGKNTIFKEEVSKYGVMSVRLAFKKTRVRMSVCMMRPIICDLRRS